MTLPERAGTLAVRLARTGFVDGARAQDRLAALGHRPTARSTPRSSPRSPAVADPDLALTALVRMAEAMTLGERQDFLAALREREGLRIRLFAVLGREPRAR